MMNKTEQKAYRWLRSHGSTGVVFRYKDSPDFLTAEGTGFEVKKVRNGVVAFTTTQWTALNAHPDVRVMFFDDSDEPLEIVDLRELPTPPSFWKQFRLLMYQPFQKAVVRPTPFSSELLKVKEVAGRLGVSVESVYRLARAGKLRAIRVGRAWRVPDSAVGEFLKRGAGRGEKIS